MVDTDVTEVIHKAYSYAEIILRKSKKLIRETSEILKRDKYLDADTIRELINKKHAYLLNLKITVNDQK